MFRSKALNCPFSAVSALIAMINYSFECTCRDLQSAATISKSSLFSKLFSEFDENLPIFCHYLDALFVDSANSSCLDGTLLLVSIFS